MYNGAMDSVPQQTLTQLQEVLIIAGPNGAGKTTFAREFLVNEASCPRSINADLIAAGLNPFQPEKAAIPPGRLMLKTIHDTVSAGESFACKTTLSGRIYARMIPEWWGFRSLVRLHFFGLSTPEKAIERVAQRVREGGHDVPQEVIRRRMAKGWRNFLATYRRMVDEWILYDSTNSPPVIVERGSNPRRQGEQESMTIKEEGLVYATEEERKSLSHAELALIALNRAAIKARRRAIRTQGYVATWRDGKMYRDTKV